MLYDSLHGKLMILVARAAHPLQPRRHARRRLDLDRRDRPRPCRCPAPGWTWPRRTAARRPSAPPRPGCAAPATSTRGAPSPRWPRRRRRCPDCPIASAGNSSQLLSVLRLLGGQLVEPRREPLGEPPGVGEHDRGPVCAHQFEEPRSTAGQIDGRWAVPAAEPTTSSSELPGRGPLVERGEIGHRHLDRHLHGLRRRAAARPRPGGRRRGTWTPRRAAGRWPTGRCAARAAPTARRAARARGPGGRRASCPRRRAPRRGSRW